MPAKLTDEAIGGKKFNKLTVIKIVGRYNSGSTPEVEVSYICDCGNIGVMKYSSIRSGNTKSCGCYGRPYKMKALKKYGSYNNWLIYNYWAIRSRCYNKKSSSYKNYGARGIRMCKSWEKDFFNFYCWCIENGWKKGLQIDRRNNNGIYSPSNCRFVTRLVNNNNRSTNRYIIYRKQKLSISQWAFKLNVSEATIRRRLNEGWTIKQIFSLRNFTSNTKLITKL